MTFCHYATVPLNIVSRQEEHVIFSFHFLPISKILMSLYL